MLLLKQNISKKVWIDENMRKSDANNNGSKKYKIEAICNNKVYIKESEVDYLPGLYYLIF